MIEQYRDELITSLQGSVDEHRVAEDREAVASDLLNILHRYASLPRLCAVLCSLLGAEPFRYSVLMMGWDAQYTDSVDRHERAFVGEY